MPDPDKNPPDTLTIISYLLAAAMLAPIAWWLKESHIIGNFLRSFFTG